MTAGCNGQLFEWLFHVDSPGDTSTTTESGLYGVALAGGGDYSSTQVDGVYDARRQYSRGLATPTDGQVRSLDNFD